ncbi:MAG: carbohydrate ABC transporter permease [Chloroflexi bacterium]|nr:carbohydrate ABC transporter permease [Chloroflexota bacterium]
MSAAIARPLARRPVPLGRRIGRLLTHLVLIVFGVVFLIPFLWLFSTSLKTDPQIFRFPPEWIPNPVTLNQYRLALTTIPFFTYTRNSLIYCVTTVVGVVLSCSLVAYGLSRVRWPGRDLLFLITLGTMLLPFEVTLVPLFIVFRTFGWIGTFLPLIVPSFFGSAFYIFLLRQFMMTLPIELSDAARIDGASELRIFWSISLPLIRPALAVVALLQFLGAWGDFLGPLVYLTDQSTYTISLGLQQYNTQYGTEWGQLMAASTLLTLPIIVLFFLTQRTFIQGVTLTGLKG